MGHSNNVAYIDGANLYNGIKESEWSLDYKKFRVWLSEKYGVQKAYIFLGFVSEYQGLYEYLRSCGYLLVFKDTVRGIAGEIKGNCDADLVLHSVRNVYESAYKDVVLLSSDGDYASLVTFLIEKDLLRVVLSPYKAKSCSILLKRTGAPISYMSDYKEILRKK